jgi:hypothetical protein
LIEEDVFSPMIDRRKRKEREISQEKKSTEREREREPCKVRFSEKLSAYVD